MELKMDIPALQAFLKTQFPQVAGELEVVALPDNGLTLKLSVHDHHLRPGGTVSGPSMFMLADVAVYLAILARLGPVALAVTTSCAMDFMRKPAAGADLVCEARLLKLGRVLAVGDAMIYSAGQVAPVARASMTYSIPPK
ncbi:PaaI family thioesterase [Yoonia sp.]|uniref:PaaI family thioesterase n=1 Tax=Yoonia sp. TaxID=2212373 RepID=UPI0025E35042|nr:PaaI family thioesterase [Yoonia sp.]